MKKRSFCFWLILLLFVGLSLWWITYFPYNAERLYRAVPLNSDIIIEHAGSADHWKDVVSHPVSRKILEYYGLNEKVLEEILIDPDVSRLVYALAAHKTLFARVPYFVGGQKPALVVASWVGRQGQLIKWSLPFVMKDKAKRVRLANGADVWVMEKMVNGGGLFFSFSFVEGVFIGCLSADPTAAGYIVGRINRGTDIALRLQERLLKKSLHTDSEADGWICFQGFGVFGYQDLSFDLDEREDGSLSGRLKWDNSNPFTLLRWSDDFAQECNEAINILGDSSGAIVFMPLPYLELNTMRADKRDKFHEIRSLLRKHAVGDTPIFLSICRPEYSGRLRGIKAPALMAGLKLKDAGKTLEALPGIIDALNSVYKLGLIVTRHNVNGKDMYVFDRVNSEMFNELAPVEKPVLTVSGDWLLLASSWNAFNGIGTGATNEMVSDGLSSDNEGFVCWLDLDSVDAALVNAAALYDLMAIAGQVNRDAPIRKKMETIKAWVDILNPMRACIVTAGHGGAQGPELHFKVQADTSLHR